jgi:hypothetical protein
LLLVDLVDEGENFGDDGVDLERDFGIELDFIEDFEEVGIAVERDVMLFGEGDYFFSNEAAAFGGEGGGGLVARLVAEGGGLGGRLSWHNACIPLADGAVAARSPNLPLHCSADNKRN